MSPNSEKDLANRRKVRPRSASNDSSFPCKGVLGPGKQPKLGISAKTSAQVLDMSEGRGYANHYREPESVPGSLQMGKIGQQENVL